ncbi:FHA domain-containing protein, putative [Babesia ovata]|uniref:FHA domain-containing protein, putative n=1 Tax=Babesia ovata TaxID=189622 RepID=A0A2H6KA11_9APIC|nr:FHA domain-containing protein, putative [Babesia ovata]GBE59842.1 FHA domain-containing protein, putative [Babesia ovata]
MAQRRGSHSIGEDMPRIKRELGMSPVISLPPRHQPSTSVSSSNELSSSVPPHCDPSTPKKVRIKEEDINTEPIYFDSTGRPLRSGANQPRLRTDHSSSTGRTTAIREIEKPNFEPSGLLAAETNKKNGVPLKYTVPPDSVMPLASWRLYMLNEPEGSEGKTEVLKTIYLDKQTHYLIGYDRRIADVELAHKSISRQHAVIQHRKIPSKGSSPYIIDLESTNGTYLNDERIKPGRYYQLNARSGLHPRRPTDEHLGEGLRIPRVLCVAARRQT